MPYIGVSPQFGVRRKHTYTATAGQTSFSGAGSEGATLSYKDSTFVDVYQNGVKLGDADYTSTSGTAIVLAQGASVSDIVEVIVFDIFSVADTVSKADGGTFDGAVTFGGGVSGVLDADDGITVDNITIDGTEIDLSSGDLTVDVAGNIVLDADGGNITIKDGGTSIGTIGVTSSDQIFFSRETGSQGIKLKNSALMPSNADGSDSDNDQDLGSSSVRWKDLYLSSGAFIGGTGAVNQLDDYEEGTWTPSVGGNASYHIQSGKYTKVGRTVHASAVIQVNALGTGSTTDVSGFPFSSSHAGGGNMGGSVGIFLYLAVNVLSLNLYYANGSTTTAFKGNTSASGNISSNLAIFGNSARVDFSITYETS